MTAAAALMLLMMAAGTAARAHAIFVAGFVVEGHAPFDINNETTRLVRSELRRQGLPGVIDADPAVLPRAGAFEDPAYWRALAEEYGAERIVTGVVKLKRAPPRVSQRSGRGGVYALQPGLFLEMEVVVIDGATGRRLASQRLPRQVQYGAGRHASPQLMYIAMLDSVLPDVVRAALSK